MNYGPLIFLGTFFSLATAWFGLVFMPHLHLGREQQVTIPETGAQFPTPRAGLAQQGAEVYRANGCYYCHTQQIRQTGSEFNLRLVKAGDNPEQVANVVSRLQPGMDRAQARQLVEAASDKKPQSILQTTRYAELAQARQQLERRGAGLQLEVKPLSSDIGRRWGARRSVAKDFLFDEPVMLGMQRIGPDLADVGTRRNNETWQLWHLYDPKTTSRDSTMPAYRHLFEVRPAGPHPSPDAMRLTAEFAPGPGLEVVPKPEAKALVAYLLSLKATQSLFEAPAIIEPVEDEEDEGQTR